MILFRLLLTQSIQFHLQTKVDSTSKMCPLLFEDFIFLFFFFIKILELAFFSFHVKRDILRISEHFLK